MTAEDRDARAAQYLADPHELRLIVTGALNSRAEQLRKRATRRSCSGPGNAETRLILRAEAKALDDLYSLLWTHAGKGVTDHLADVAKAAAL